MTMASTSSFHSLLFCSQLFIIIIMFMSSTSPSLAQTPSFRPKALFVPVTKDSATLQYLTTLNQRTPLVPIKLTIDLGGRHLWVDCETNYISSTNKSARCNSAQCKLAMATTCTTQCNLSAPDCNICTTFPGNTVTRTGSGGAVRLDIVSLQSTNGFNPGKIVSIPNVLFSCSFSVLLDGLANGVKGMAGLGWFKMGLPSQFASAFSFPRKFAICLPSSSTRSHSTGNNGFIIFGDGPYTLLPKNDVSKSLTFTPLLKNPNSTANIYSQGEPSSEYFINVKSIKINGKVVALNTSLLTFDHEGNGGTKISTVDPYTVLETSIYNAVVNSFVKVMGDNGIPRVKSIAPFGACFNAKNILGGTGVFPSVPTIELVLGNGVSWRMYGGNSMVQVGNGVLCLGFVDDGVRKLSRWANIVIGGRQLENYLLQIDLAVSRLGFSSSLLATQTSCSNFNFTSIA